MKCKYERDGKCSRSGNPYRKQECPVPEYPSVCRMYSWLKPETDLRYKCGSCRFGVPFAMKDGDKVHIRCINPELRAMTECSGVKARSAPCCKRYEAAK